MKGRMYIYRPGQPAPEVREIERPTLDVIKAGLDGGHLEAVPGFLRYREPVKPHGAKRGRPSPCVAFCDEEGKMKGLPHNLMASTIWYNQLGRVPDDHLVGPIVILCGDAAFMAAI